MAFVLAIYSPVTYFNVPFLVQTIGESFVLQKQLEKQISTIKEGLKALNDSFQAGSHDDVSRNLALRDIRDLVYRFENLLEALVINSCGEADQEYSPAILAAKRIPIWSSATHLKFCEIASEIERIRHKNYRIFNHNYGPYFFVERKQEMERLLSYLCSHEELGTGQLTISISGMRGIGKTTLAEQLYKHPIVKSYYTSRAFIRVRPNFHKRKILKEIIRELELPEDLFSSWGVSDDMDDMVEDVLLRLISTRTTLIVLDEICSLDDWNSLKLLLEIINNNDSRSKILITTRVKVVAQKAARCVHLGRLTDEEVCELLVKNVPEFLVRRMREDLREKGLTFCGGNPLIIRSFLQCMETKHTLKEWEEMVSERDNSVFRRPETLEIQKTLEIITSTYHDLPHDLLPFFLYMGVLQEEDLRVDAEKLYLLSLADGLLKPLQREEERPLDTAQRCITEVAQKTMMDLDEGEEPTITRFKYCSARFKYCSEIIRDLSLLKNKDEGFFKFVDFTSESLLVSDSFSSSSEFRTCRAAINLDKYEEGHRFSLQDNEIRHMRVLLFSAKKKKTWPRKVSSLVKFKFLRVLDFNGINFELTRLPKGIGRAIHLRYLSFKDCVLPKLPASIGNLKFLCILDLRAQHSPKMIIPNVLWKMKKLKHLFFPQLFRTHNASKLRLDGLTELETITNFNVAMSSVKDLFEMPKLQYLDANVVGNLEELEGVIERMMNSDVNLLRTSLDVKNFDCYTEKRHSAFRKLLAYQSLTALCMEGHIRHMPIYHNFSMNLSKIVFTGSGLVEDPMATLEKLPKLRVLVLDDAFVGEKIVCSASGFVDLEKNETAPGFAELKVLKLLNLHQLKEWIMEDGAMPKLSTVVIASCGQLAKLPGILQCAPWSSAKDESLTNARRFSKQDSRGNRPSTCHNHIRGLITSPDDMHIS